jgi:hypothetical protein
MFKKNIHFSNNNVDFFFFLLSPKRFLSKSTIWVTRRVSYKKQELLILLHAPEFTPTPEFTPYTWVNPYTWVHPLHLSSPHTHEFTPYTRVHPIHLSSPPTPEFIPYTWVHPYTWVNPIHLSSPPTPEFTPYTWVHSLHLFFVLFVFVLRLVSGVALASRLSLYCPFGVL